MGIRATVVSADWIGLTSLWDAPTSPHQTEENHKNERQQVNHFPAWLTFIL